MARICPQCSLPNPDRSAFCSHCGATLPVEEIGTPMVNNYAPSPQPFQQAPVVQENKAPSYEEPYSSVPSQASPAANPINYVPPSQQAFPSSSPQQSPQLPFPPYAPTGPTYSAPANDPYAAPGSVYGPTGPQPQLQQAFPGQPQASQPPPPQGLRQRNMPDLNLAVVQRGFAGKGTPMTHASWLVDGKQVESADLRTAIVEKVQQRYPNELKASQEHLSERETVVEERDYVKIERAPARVFVYVTRFGPDLYISRTTTVQPALSPIRIVVFALLFLLMLIGFIIAAATNPSAANLANYIGALQFKSTISLFSSILLIFFIALVGRSLLLWLTEKDYLVYLRPNILNDFRLDDGTILEHITDRGIREAVEELGLDASELSKSANSYPTRQPLHRF